MADSNFISSNSSFLAICSITDCSFLDSSFPAVPGFTTLISQDSCEGSKFRAHSIPVASVIALVREAGFPFNKS